MILVVIILVVVAMVGVEKEEGMRKECAIEKIWLTSTSTSTQTMDAKNAIMMWKIQMQSKRSEQSVIQSQPRILWMTDNR
mmetsp:Transcript_18525/g.38600  ORF Transcript_18525/g.38600 Transcript_18525/m.38600 type:complete len:80 (-) Transcript_18525:77-316(-)